MTASPGPVAVHGYRFGSSVSQGGRGSGLHWPVVWLGSHSWGQVEGPGQSFWLPFLRPSPAPLPPLLSVLETGPEGWGILSSRAASVGVAAGIQCILHGSQVKYTTTISGALVCRLETPGLTSIDGYTATARREAGNLLVG